jgi:hypothetical protein
MEQSLYITKTENLHYWRDEFHRLYFGVEFCQRLLPSPAKLTKAIKFALKQNKNFTLVTPYVTNSGLNKVEKLLDLLSELYPESEIVFNDWGVYHLLKEKAFPIKPVLGRLLNKMKRGPRIVPVQAMIPKTSSNYFMTPGCSIPATQQFLLDQGIKRVEFDNLLQGLKLDGITEKLHLSLYLPFAYVTTTRFCFMSSSPVSDDFTIGVLPCKKECQDYAFTLHNPVMTTPLIRKGNTLFFSNETIPEQHLRSRRIDRIVVQPELPL